LEGIAFYICAHQDDWQLFRGEQAYKDIVSPNTKIIFIYTTAGDAGRDDSWWKAREEGCLASCIEITKSQPSYYETSDFLSHTIYHRSCGNTVSYFMRLPDVYDVKTGQDKSKNLANLRDEKISDVSTVDNSSSYDSWSDFCETIREIMLFESSQSSQLTPIWANMPDWDIENTPDDHSDHVATGCALNSFVQSSFNQVWWVGYNTKYRDENLDNDDYKHKRDMLLAYCEKIKELTGIDDYEANNWNLD
jgi:hypothetical protein